MAPPEVNADHYTTLPRARRTSLPSSNLRNSIRVNHRLRAASTSYSPMRPSFNHASVTHTSRPDIRSQNAQNARVKPRPYTKPDPDTILPEIKKLLGDFPASAPPQQQIRDFLDVDEIFALHDRDIMDRREREDHRGARNDQGLTVFGVHLRQVSMYASGFLPLASEPRSCAYEIPLVASMIIQELQERGVNSALPFLHPKPASRARILHLCQLFDSSPYYPPSSPPFSESTTDLCALLKMYILALPEPMFSEAVSEGLWRWCIRPSLEENDLRALESRKDFRPTTEGTRIRIAALLFRLLPSANVGLLVHLLDFFSHFGSPEDSKIEEGAPGSQTEYTEAGRLFGEAIFGSSLGGQKSTSRQGAKIPGNARAVSIMLWVLRCWSSIRPFISGISTPSGNLIRVDHIHERKHPGSELILLAAPIPKYPPNYPGMASGCRNEKANIRRSNEFIVAPQGGRVSPPTGANASSSTPHGVALNREENISSCSTQALDERLVDVNLLTIPPMDMELNLSDLSEPEHSHAPPTSSISHSSPTNATGAGEEQGNLKRIEELDKELRDALSNAAAAKETQEKVEAEVRDLREQLARSEQREAEITAQRDALQERLNDANAKTTSTENENTDLTASLVTLRKELKALEVDRDAKAHIVDEMKRVLAVI
ncbi:hypothetical protein PC9H_006301 [Pleurotus ostreatus]|uniref:Rho-GAP domain-containing protein n=1 Tax=Pleurotus ostreatus TaxID=5322 RepID=A0A8H7DSW6_PLEOS|nr:uncharacterized protein PC9H_006301 [Pleurotus ostreatus]KAF7430593.1 hypothetical protein PC9H_006301 [Pleurotus ostreatus]